MDSELGRVGFAPHPVVDRPVGNVRLGRLLPRDFVQIPMLRDCGLVPVTVDALTLAVVSYGGPPFSATEEAHVARHLDRMRQRRVAEAG